LAEGRFVEVIKLQPDHALALNNLAWAMHQLKKPGAIAHAERANQLRPNTPALMDTLAILLADGDQAGKALELQKRAVELAPDAPALRLTLARLYLQSGDKVAARAELERLHQLGDKFGDQKAVQQLLAQV
jgi:cellulose synthase operon protein C